ncbi:ABC transporter permease [soil metagenome]
MPKTIIESGRANSLYWSDLWRYRELFAFLSWRDILVRYKQTTMGVAWAIVRPVLTMVVFTIVFGKLAKMPSGGVPYPILVFSAMLPWQFFASSLAEASNSLVTNANMVAKVYFPRMVLPFSSVMVSFVDLLISFVILCAMMVWYDIWPTWRFIALVPLTAIAFMCSFAAGLWFSALNVEYRDFRYVVPFIVQFGLYVSPVGFSSAVVPEKWRLLYSLNPMVGVIDGFRWAIADSETALYWPGFAISTAMVGILLVAGLFYFRRMERTFADVI